MKKKPLLSCFRDLLDKQKIFPIKFEAKVSALLGKGLKISTLVHGNKAKPKRPGLALLRCKMTFQIFGLGLIAVQNEFSNFRAWPYCGEK